MAPPNVKIKHLIRSSSGNSRFPKLDECAHFHYENVELGPIKVVLCDKQTESNKVPVFLNSSPNKENEVDWFFFLVLVVSNGRKWVVRRSYNDFVFLDTQLHRCVYDRKYSLLCELQTVTQEDLRDKNAEENIRSSLTEYLERFSQLAGSLITCGPVLNWLELDNRGNRLIVTDEVAINTPAVAAAYVVMRYTAQAADEISFDVGDMISVIDMPPPDESTWWRGKRGFEVGFFPSECVEVIGDKVPRGFKLSNASTKPVFRKHGKLIAFFRSFLLSRPSRRKLKQSGILKERVFGCDLGEHLSNTEREIPLVLKCCTEFIEEHGVVDGIYRLSGVSSNIQRLRNAFDEDCATNLGDPAIAQDVHSVASLLKMYFRELPNPLLTYQLYDKFVSAVQSSEDVRLLRIRDVVQQLPPPHYRTLQYLLCHLTRVASYGEQTGMTPKNIAIVWAPNLLRSRDVENGGVGALHVVGIQAVLTEYLIRYCDLIFDEKMAIPSMDEEGTAIRTRPKSLAISTPTKLLSLEEARARALSAHLPLTSQQKYIDVGGGPDKLPSKYHTVIELPAGKQVCPKLKKSPSGWKSFFSRGWYSGSTRDKSRPSFRSSRKSSTASLPHTSTQLQEKVNALCESQYQHKKLRTVKSAESLIQCSKDSSPTSNVAHKPSDSRRSSPEASMDSSFSYEAASSPSKSPSLQKHTRSSSHESYFDNSMDMIADPPGEDEEEHSIFYYVNEQMQKMQQFSPSAWQEKRRSIYDSVCEGETQLLSNPSHEKNVENSPAKQDESEKVVRKQKLDLPHDFAHAKMQRLSWMENRNSEDTSNVGEEAKSLSRHDVNNENPTGLKSPSDDCSFWLPRSDQAMFCKLSGNHEEGYKLDPFSFYDCTLDKRSSCVSSSDNETDFGARTVVERYGNAETILVEVHATQDSSSESESEVSKFLQHFEIRECVLTQPKVEPSKLESVGSASPTDDSVFESPELSNVETCTDVEKTLNSIPIVEEQTVQEVFDLVPEGSTIEDEEECPLLVNIFPDNVNLIQFEDTTIVTVPDNVVDVPLTFPVSDSSDICPIYASANESVKTPDNSTSKLEDDDDTKVAIQTTTSPIRERLTLDLSVCAKEFELEKMDTEYEVFRVKTPPSPVYPQSMKAEFQSLQLKIDHIPLPKKRQVFSIPSPSSPMEEVRKKFELQSSTSFDKQKDNNQSSYKSQQTFKDVPSKLSIKQKQQMFEIQDSGKNENINYSKRKSDGAILSKKVEDLPAKRHSEPLAPFEDTSPSEKANKVLFSQDSSNIAHSPTEAYPCDSKTKSSPSLFTQMKVRKLQSLQGSTPTTPVKAVDPWSDPILDMQEEYHPLPSYPQFMEISDSPVVLSDVPLVTSSPLQSLTDNVRIPSDVYLAEVLMPFVECEQADSSDTIELQSTLSETQSKDTVDCESSSIEKLPVDTTDESSELEKLSSGSRLSETIESEFVRRERINRIKEERRAQLREKLKNESFRMEAEEKEKVQSKFRLRKDLCRHGLEVSGEAKQSGKSEDRESQSNVQCGEVSEQKFDCVCDKTSATFSCGSEESSVPFSLCETTSSNVSIASQSINSQSASPSSRTVPMPPSLPVEMRKSGTSVETPRSSVFRRSNDIRDRVAMFERSKDTTEPCRLGPNGKYPQKQGAPTSLTPSYVR